MKRRGFLRAVSGGAFVASRAVAANSLPTLGAGAAVVAGSSYTGPGDIVSGAAFWGGLRGYNGTVAATGTQKAVRVRRASDNTETDVVIQTNGALDTASALTFAGTDVTGNATSSGTSVALTGLATAAHIGSTIAGTGFSGSYCVSVGSLVAGAQTVTTNTSQSIGVSEPVTLTWGLYVTKCYNQSGGSGTDPAQATEGNQPLLLPDGGAASNGKPIMVFSGGSQVLNGTITALNQPYTMSAIGERTAAFTSTQALLSTYTGSGSNGVFYFQNSANLLTNYAGTGFTAAGTDSVMHAAQSTFNGGSSVIVVDNVSTSGNSGTSATSTSLSLGAHANGAGSNLQGLWFEGGLWGSLISGGNLTLINANQHTYGPF